MNVLSKSVIGLLGATTIAGAVYGYHEHQHNRRWEQQQHRNAVYWVQVRISIYGNKAFNEFRYNLHPYVPTKPGTVFSGEPTFKATELEAKATIFMGDAWNKGRANNSSAWSPAGAAPNSGRSWTSRYRTPMGKEPARTSRRSAKADMSFG